VRQDLLADPSPGIRFNADMGRWLRGRKYPGTLYSMRQVPRWSIDLPQPAPAAQACASAENYLYLSDA
jgi:hypothetical protein